MSARTHTVTQCSRSEANKQLFPFGLGIIFGSGCGPFVFAVSAKALVPKQNHMVLFCYFSPPLYLQRGINPAVWAVLSLRSLRFCHHLLHSKIFDPPELSTVAACFPRRSLGDQLRVVPRVFGVLDQKRQRDFFFKAPPLLTSLSTLSCQAHHLCRSISPSPWRGAAEVNRQVGTLTSVGLVPQSCKSTSPQLTWSLKWSPHTSKWKQHPRTRPGKK